MIKLYRIGSLEDGTERFQTQLHVGKNICNFIQEPDGKMKIYRYGDNGFDFYNYNHPYKIVTDIEGMRVQRL